MIDSGPADSYFGRGEWNIQTYCGGERNKNERLSITGGGGV